MENENSTETPADAADSSTTETTPEITPEISQDGATPSEENDGGDGTGAANEEDAASFLEQFGSKFIDGLVVPGPDVPSKGAKADAALTAEAETPPGETAAGEAAAPEKDPADGTGKPAEKPPANNYRLNLKGAKDADQKRLVIEIMRDEPEVTLAEAMERAGIVVNAKAPAATAPETQGKAPEAPADPFKAQRDEIAALKDERRKAQTDEYDFSRALELADQIAEKQRVLDRAEDRAQAQAEAQRQVAVQQFQGDVNKSWGSVRDTYPDALKTGTDFHTALVTARNLVHSTNPGFFSDPAWPTKLAESVALQRGFQPAKAPAAPKQPPAKQPTGKPPLVPKKPSVPAPVSGGTSSAPAGVQTSALDAEDFLEKHGTRLAK